MSKIDKRAILDEYASHSFQFERFREALISQIEELLKSNEITLGFPVQSRIKSVESIVEKQESKRFTIKKSILELNDIIGFRIILLFKRDVESVRKLIKENFELFGEKDPSVNLKHNQFGYSSIHYTVKIPESWLNVPTLKNLEQYKAEIQLRTLSQHNWAETSNLLQYKNEANVPSEILRSIGRVSALLEIVDLELERTLQERDDYNLKISTSLDGNQLLNIDLFSQIVDDKMPNYIIRNIDGYTDILDELRHFEINSADQLINLIDNNLKFEDGSVFFYQPSDNEWITKPEKIGFDDDSIISFALICIDVAKWWDFIELKHGSDQEEE